MQRATLMEQFQKHQNALAGFCTCGFTNVSSLWARMCFGGCFGPVSEPDSRVYQNLFQGCIRTCFRGVSEPASRVFRNPLRRPFQNVFAPFRIFRNLSEHVSEPVSEPVSELVSEAISDHGSERFSDQISENVLASLRIRFDLNLGARIFT